MASTFARNLSQRMHSSSFYVRRQFHCSLLARSFSSQQGAQLHLDWIGPAPPTDDHCNHLVVFLHGLLGNGRNLRTMAKKLCEGAQQTGILVDVRGHGKSSMPPNSTQTSDFHACVEDLQQTLHSLPQVSSEDTSITLVGHSLGGRISLQYAYNSVLSGHHQYPLNRVWLLDTVPGEANDSVERVVGAVTQLSTEEGGITDKKKLVEQLNSDRFQIDQGTAQWLAASLKKNSSWDGLEFGFDLAVVNDLLAHFHQQDFMQLLEEVVESDVRVDLVRGGKNKGWTESTVGPLEKLEQQHSSNLGIHLLPKAGHWVHVDDLPGLLEVMDVAPR